MGRGGIGRVKEGESGGRDSEGGGDWVGARVKWKVKSSRLQLVS